MAKKKKDESEMIFSEKDDQASPAPEEPGATAGEKTDVPGTPERIENDIGEIESELEDLFEWDLDDHGQDSGGPKEDVVERVDEKAEPESSAQTDDADIEETFDISDLVESGEIFSPQEKAADLPEASEAVDSEETIDLEDLDEKDDLASLQEKAAELARTSEETPAEVDVEDTVDISELDADGSHGPAEKEAMDTPVSEPEAAAEKADEADVHVVPGKAAAEDIQVVPKPTAAKTIPGSGKRFRILAVLLGLPVVIGLIIAFLPIDQLFQKEPAEKADSVQTPMVEKKSPPAPSSAAQVKPAPSVPKKASAPSKPAPSEAKPAPSRIEPTPPAATEAPSAPPTQAAAVKSPDQTLAEPAPPTEESEAEKDVPEKPAPPPESIEKEEPEAAIETKPPVKVLHPWSIHTDSYRKRESADKQVAAYRQQGLDAYWVEANLGKKGIWYRVYVGQFAGEDNARQVIGDHDFQDARPLKTAYAALVGTFDFESRAENMRRELGEKGYSPYVLQDPPGEYHLYIGAFVYKKSAERYSAKLNANGVRCRVVER